MRFFTLLMSAALLLGGVSKLDALTCKKQDVRQLVEASPPKAFDALRIVDENGKGIDIPGFVFVLEDKPGTKYNLFLFAIDPVASPCKGIPCIVGDDHYLMKPDRKSMFIMPMPGLGPGMYMEIYAMASDRSRAYTTPATPHPVKAKSGPYHMDLYVTHPLALHFFMLSDGFEPGENVKVEVTSGKSTHQMEVIADERGSVGIPYQPELDDEDGGYFDVTAYGKHGKIKIRSPWGRTYMETYLRKR